MNQDDLNKVKALALTMRVNPVHDYVIPGLTSSLMGAGAKGTVRLFTQERTHEEPITPHSHRFDFSCLVLSGRVKNRIWVGDLPPKVCAYGDEYERTKLVHHGQFGKYDVEHLTNEPRLHWHFMETEYRDGEWYHMKAEQIHSIFFGRGSVVMFIEGPNRLDHSFVLEPVSDGRVIPTFKVEPWMFRRE